MQCPNCQHTIADEMSTCPNCGNDLTLLPGDFAQHDTIPVLDRNEVADTWKTTQVDEIEYSDSQGWGGARFDQETRLTLRVSSTDSPIEVDIIQTGGIILGRADPRTSWSPDVDLTPYDGLQKGISRKHARIDVLHDTLYITDLSSSNGTYLNGRRLDKAESRLMRDGDTIHLGNLKIYAYFVTIADVAGQKSVS